MKNGRSSAGGASVGWRSLTEVFSVGFVVFSVAFMVVFSVGFGGLLCWGWWCSLTEVFSVGFGGVLLLVALTPCSSPFSRLLLLVFYY